VHRPEKLGAFEAEDQSDNAQDPSGDSRGAHRGIKPADAWLGELLPARHGLSEIERPGRVDTVPFALLYLAAMETAKTPLESFPSIGHP